MKKIATRTTRNVMHVKVVQLSQAVTTTSRPKICLCSWFKIPRYKSGLHQNIRRGWLAARNKSIWDGYMMKVAFLMVSTGMGISKIILNRCDGLIQSMLHVYSGYCSHALSPHCVLSHAARYVHM